MAITPIGFAASLAKNAASRSSQKDVDKAHEEALEEERHRQEEAERKRQEMYERQRQDSYDQARAQQDAHEQLKREGDARENKPSASAWISLFLIVFALIIHFIHWYFFDFAPAYSVMVPLYTLHALLLGFFLSRGHLRVFFKEFGVSLLVAGLSIAVTALLAYFTNSSVSNPFVRDIAGFAILLFPIYVYYTIFNPSLEVFNIIRVIASFLVLGVFVLAAISLVGEFSFPIPDSYQGVDASEGFGNIMGRLWDGSLSFFTSIGSGIDQASQRLDPRYYTGQVERSEEQPLGVRLEEVGPIDPYFTEESNPRVAGFVSARSFIRDSIYVNPTCAIDHLGTEEAVSGEPAQLEIFSGLDGRFECTFDPLEQGRYPVTVSATFDFETWADITYYFVDEGLARDYAQQGEDIYERLDIPRTPEAIFTDGPMRLGMRDGSSRMPILVSDEEPYLTNANLGVSLDSQWRGELNRVESITLIIPNAFFLHECNRGGTPEPVPDENVVDADGNSLYDRYTFENVDPNEAYTSISCGLSLASPEALAGLQSSDVVTRTFIAMADYSYTVEEDTEVRVE